MIRLAARTLKHFALTLVMLVVGVCGLEIALRAHRVLTAGQQLSAAAPSEESLAVPSRTTYLTVAPRINVQRTSSKRSKTYSFRTNSFGLRNEEVAVPRDPRLFRILCLGDELTLAPELSERETFCDRLSRELVEQTSTPVEVLNAGCPGSCPTIAALTLRHRLLGLAPDVILLQMSPGDFEEEVALQRHILRSEDGLPVAAIHPSLAGKDGVASHLDEEFLVVQTARDFVRDLWRKGHAAPDAPRTDRALSDSSSDVLEDVRRALVALRKMAESQSSLLIVVTADTSSGEGSGRMRGARAGASPAWPTPELVKLCAEEGIPLIDASADIAAACAAAAPARAVTANRWPAAGHQALGGVLADEILKRFAVDDAVPDQADERDQQSVIR